MSSRSFLRVSFGVVILPLLISACLSYANEKKEGQEMIMNLPQAIDRIRPCVLQIVVMALHLSEELRSKVGTSFLSIPMGTGFLVNSEGYVITANHVIDESKKLLRDDSWLQAKRKSIQIGLALPLTENFRGNFHLVDSDLIDVDTTHDLALLKLKQNPFKGEVHLGVSLSGKEIPNAVNTATLSLDRPQDGDAIALSGYPLSNPVLITKGGWVATSWSYDRALKQVPGAPPGFVFPYIGDDTYLADIEVNPGNSGGPVYLVSNAKVIGMAVAMQRTSVTVTDEEGKEIPIKGPRFWYSSGLTVVTPARYIDDLLKKNGIK
jgi:S1-C subfamily serine protease